MQRKNIGTDRRNDSLTQQIKYFDIFAGIGGFRSGLSHYGDFFMPIGFCEIDPYARRAYEAIYDTKRQAKEAETHAESCNQ